jgi:hypothetical protein
MNLHKLLLLAILWLILALTLPTLPVEAEPKPRTVCWTKTMPHSSIYHRAPCKGLINHLE